MLADKKKVVELIPQKYPMVMVDGLISSDKDTTVSSLNISKNNIFFSEGHFTEPGLIENIAQTAALRSGYESVQSNVPPTIGYIGSAKRIKIYNLPKHNDVLRTKITILTRLLNVLIIKGEILVNEKLIAECEMNIFLQESTNED